MLCFKYTDKDISKAIQSFKEQLDNREAYVVAHTSGSTGKPKEIRLLKEDMRVSARATNERFNTTSDSHLLCPLSLNYIAAKMMAVRAIEANCDIRFLKPSNDFWSSEDFLEYISQGEVAILPIVPSQCISLIEHLKTDKFRNAIGFVKNIIIGGAPLPPNTEQHLLEALPTHTNAYATYGMTETCSHVALRKLGSETYTAMPGIGFATDSRQCLQIHAPKFSFKSLQTNDIVELLNENEFRWLGRFDNVINSGGVKIFPEEIERKIEGYIQSPFYIKGTPDMKWGEAVTLVTTASNQSDETILSICEQYLQPYQRPKKILRIKEIPLTPNGKVKRI